MKHKENINVTHNKEEARVPIKNEETKQKFHN